MSNILYRNPVIVFDDLIQFNIIPIIDEANMQHMFHIHQQTQVQQQNIGLYVKFENIDRDFETTYEIGEKDEDGDVKCETILKNVVVPPAVSQPMDDPHFMCSLDLDAIHAPKFSKYANIGVANPRTGSSGLKWNTVLKKWSSRQLRVILSLEESTIICLYVLCKIQDLDSNTVAEVIRPLVETDPSVKVKSIITEIQSRFNYTINYRKTWLEKYKSIPKEESYKIFPSWFSVMIQKMHIGSNFLRAIKAPYLQKFVVNVGYSRIVEECNNNYKSVVVDLVRQMCDCGHFEVERLTYRHVIAYCAN
ncbi:hypothetical protein Ahy_B09g099824 [Arachis hypogaea]|uniref:Uncharacterized protein n=1 Tax=Arachis hypogaea TaxID=3818 RepID=A0A444XV08_ARAHY|nr:hypothetical protein Ahy_B09g099824 [Arachis hypogaea]